MLIASRKRENVKIEKILVLTVRASAHGFCNARTPRETWFGVAYMCVFARAYTNEEPASGDVQRGMRRETTGAADSLCPRKLYSHDRDPLLLFLLCTARFDVSLALSLFCPTLRFFVRLASYLPSLPTIYPLPKFALALSAHHPSLSTSRHPSLSILVARTPIRVLNRICYRDVSVWAAPGPRSSQSRVLLHAWIANQPTRVRLSQESYNPLIPPMFLIIFHFVWGIVDALSISRLSQYKCIARNKVSKTNNFFPM